LISAILIAWTGIFQGQTGRPQSNLEIFDKQISDGLEEIFWKPDIRRDVQFVFKIMSLKNSDEEIKFLTSVIKKYAEKNRLRASFTKETASSDTVFNSVRIDIAELGTKYPGFSSNKFLGDKTIKRNLSGSIAVEISGGNYVYNDRDSIIINYKDEVDYEEIENIESGNYSFSHSAAPAISTFEELFFPAAIITVSALAAVLFFVIRSK